MRLWISASLWLLCAGLQAQAPEKSFLIRLTERKKSLVGFDLDFGGYEIRHVQAYLDKRFPSVRLPASVSKSGWSRPEIDFAEPGLRLEVLKGLRSLLNGDGSVSGSEKSLRAKRSNPIDEIATAPSEPRNDKQVGQNSLVAGGRIRVVSLEKLEKMGRSLRVAKGELWLDERLAVRFSVMRSKWSADPENWWIAWPAEWQSRDSRWEDLFVVKDKTLKKQIVHIVRETCLERFQESE